MRMFRSMPLFYGWSRYSGSSNKSNDDELIANMRPSAWDSENSSTRSSTFVKDMIGAGKYLIGLTALAGVASFAALSHGRTTFEKNAVDYQEGRSNLVCTSVSNDKAETIVMPPNIRGRLLEKLVQRDGCEFRPKGP